MRTRSPFANDVRNPHPFGHPQNTQLTILTFKREQLIPHIHMLNGIHRNTTAVCCAGTGPTAPRHHHPISAARIPLLIMTSFGCSCATVATAVQHAASLYDRRGWPSVAVGAIFQRESPPQCEAVVATKKS